MTRVSYKQFLDTVFINCASLTTCSFSLFLSLLCLYFTTCIFSLFQTLSGLGILPAIEFILGLDDMKVKCAAIDIFSYIVEFSPSMVREFILKEGQNQEDVRLWIQYFPDTFGYINLLSKVNLRVAEICGELGKYGIYRTILQLYA